METADMKRNETGMMGVYRSDFERYERQIEDLRIRKGNLTRMSGESRKVESRLCEIEAKEIRERVRDFASILGKKGSIGRRKADELLKKVNVL